MDSSVRLSAVAAATVTVFPVSSPCSSAVFDMSAARAAIASLAVKRSGVEKKMFVFPETGAAVKAKYTRPREEEKSPLESDAARLARPRSSSAPARPGEGRQRSNACGAQELSELVSSSASKRFRVEGLENPSSEEEEREFRVPASGGAGSSFSVATASDSFKPSFEMAPATFSLDSVGMLLCVDLLKGLIAPVVREAGAEALTRPILEVTKFLVSKMNFCVPLSRLEESLSRAFSLSLMENSLVKKEDNAAVSTLYVSHQIEAAIVGFKKKKMQSKCQLIASYRTQIEAMGESFEKGLLSQKLILEIHHIEDILADLLERGETQEELERDLAMMIQETHKDFPLIQESALKISERWMSEAKMLQKT